MTFKRGVVAVAVLVCLAGGSAAASQAASQSVPQTWTGKISEDKCAASYALVAPGTGEHDCVLARVKAGSPYIFLVGKKSYKIANQTFLGLDTHAGHDVLLTGTVKDDTITIAKLTLPRVK